MRSAMLRFQRRVRHRLASSLAPPLPRPQSEVLAFYPQHRSCQIPHFYYLLEHFFGASHEGHYVEVGAYDGLFASNTWGLAKRGWSGLLIEPVPELAESCRRNYAGFPKVQVVQSAVGRERGTLTLHLANQLTTANPDTRNEYATIEWARASLTLNKATVEVRTLDEILSSHSVPTGFDVLVVDVEGFEAAVFDGFGLSRWMPKMIVVELADTHPDLRSTAREDAVLGALISNAGYRIVFKDHINTVFVRVDVHMSAYQGAGNATSSE